MFKHKNDYLQNILVFQMQFKNFLGNRPQDRACCTFKLSSWLSRLWGWIYCQSLIFFKVGSHLFYFFIFSVHYYIQHWHWHSDLFFDHSPISSVFEMTSSFSYASTIFLSFSPTLRKRAGEIRTRVAQSMEVWMIHIYSTLDRSTTADPL